MGRSDRDLAHAAAAAAAAQHGSSLAFPPRTVLADLPCLCPSTLRGTVLHIEARVKGCRSVHEAAAEEALRLCHVLQGRSNAAYF